MLYAHICSFLCIQNDIVDKFDKLKSHKKIFCDQLKKKKKHGYLAYKIRF